PFLTATLSCDACDAHPYLHSFPTRRSSDLIHTTNAIGNAAVGVPDVTFRIEVRLLRAPLLVGRVELLVERQVVFDVHGPGEHSLDRKSTRLNSSHQIISYAVFCLKKKRDGRETRNKTMSLITRLTISRTYNYGDYSTEHTS